MEENFLLELLALCLRPRYAKFQRSSARGTLSSSGLIEWDHDGMKNVRFPMESWPYLRNGERYGQGLIANRK